MSRILEYDKWISENESDFVLAQEVADNLVEKVPEVKAFKESGILLHSHFLKESITILIDCSSLQKIEWNLEKDKFEITPNYFDLGNIDFNYLPSDKLKNGEFSVDMWFAKKGHGFKNSIKIDGKSYQRREFVIEFNCKTEAEFHKIVKDSIHQIVKDEFCKVRFLLSDNKWSTIKKSLSKHVLKEYKDLIENFFFKGQVPEKGEYDLVPMVARSYEEDSTDLPDMIRLADEDFVTKLIKYSEENLSSEFTTKIKKLAKMKDILKMI
jgi:hypothetical protein